MKLPEDDDDENFPIGVSEESSEESDEDGSGLEDEELNIVFNNDISDENESNADSFEKDFQLIEENENSIISQEFASGEGSDD